MSVDETGPSALDQALTHLRAAGGDGRLVAERTQPARAPRYAPWPTWVPDPLREALVTTDRPELWAHQVDAAEALHRGLPTVISTGTGSGKSLAAWLDYLARAHDVLAHPARLTTAVPTACLIAPTKALARDQMHMLSALNARAGGGLRVGTADGDTARAAKEFARTRAHVVVTNPDFVHHALLPAHRRWTHLLRSLHLVVVDEMHSYRGVTGAHVALTLRRLLRQARGCGANPVVAFLSATCANPAEAAARFLGCEASAIHAVTDDASGTGRRTVIVWRPRLVDAGDDADDSDLGGLLDDGDDPAWQALTAPADGVGHGDAPRRSVLREGGELTAELVASGARLLAFTRSRAGAEALAGIARDTLAKRSPGDLERVRAYRGGYLPEERRGLEADLREGRLRALATTSALELGIDVAGLDATISCAWPGTAASFWQQAGRAGRAGRDGVNVLVVSDNPLDAYLADHPDQLWQEVEASVFDTTNPYVLGPHLCCAAAESPLTDADLALFGLADDTVVRTLAARGLLVRRRSGWCWDVTAPGRPWDLVDIRGGGHAIQVVRAGDGTIIGSIDQANADSQAHPGAIYVHQGSVYRVCGRDAEVALVEPAPPKLRTRVTAHTSVRILATHATRAGTDPRVTWHIGDVEVERQVTDYDLLRLPGLTFVGNHRLDLAPRTFPTRAVWWTLDADLVAELALGPDTLPGALHAAEHASIGLLPLLATCDRWDLGGLSIAEHPQTGLATAFVYDGAPGGAGFSEYGYSHARAWMHATWQRVRACGCTRGCPGCIQSPKCGTNNDPLYKAGATDILARLAEASARLDYPGGGPLATPRRSRDPR